MLVVEQLEFQSQEMKDSIGVQIKKIITDPLFARCHILQKFLGFIVEETLFGRSNRLKEYTIGVHVLGKPNDFNPQSSSIVRIHAVRLRKLLQEYYSGSGLDDKIIVTLPQGHYIPVFLQYGSNSMNDSHLKKSISALQHSPLIMAVVPFYINHDSENMKRFTDGFGSSLTDALLENASISVVPYFTTRRLSLKYADIREVAKQVSAKYLFTGDVQVLESRIKISVQVVNGRSGLQEWSHAWESKFSAHKLFEQQDQIIQKLLSAVSDKIQLLAETEKKKAMMAVA